MKPLVIYHANCADGYGAAFAVWMKLGDAAEYVPMQYGFTTVPDYVEREVYMLDFSWPRKLMDDLFLGAKRVVWLDHHKTAFEAFGLDPEKRHDCDVLDPQQLGKVHTTILDNGKSGAMLAWEFFHPGEAVPMLIRHIDDRDRWQFKIPGSREIHAALWARYPWSFEQWDDIFCYLNAEGVRCFDNLDIPLFEGEAILRAHDGNVASVVKGAGRACAIRVSDPTQFNDTLDLPGIAANCPPHLASDVGHALAERSGTFGLLWHVNKDGKCICSLRSNGDYDVSAIAKAFGGGGHRNAAGFEVQIETLLGWIK